MYSTLVIALALGLAQAQFTPPEGFTRPEGGFTPPEGFTRPEGGFTPPEGFTRPEGGGGFTTPAGGFTRPEGGFQFTTPEGGFTRPNGETGGQTTGGDDSSDEYVEPTEFPTEPAECSAENMGRCECGDTSDNFQTYTFWQNDQQRCFTVYHPSPGSALPVVFHPNCYAQDKLQGHNAITSRTDDNQAAKRFGFARLMVSTPDGHWEFGNDMVVNDDYPMPCKNEDSKDIEYIRTIFDFLDDNQDKFDTSKIYAAGFSQNSMFSAYIGFCFNDKVKGIWQAGSGMALTNEEPFVPNCGAQVKASQMAQCDADGDTCRSCYEKHPCTECMYWPIYPCYSPVRPMVHCIAEYTNDPIAVGQADPDNYSSGKYMYERSEREGHDARLFRFTPTDDTVPGSHKDQQNLEYWRMGCLGLNEPCSDVCEASFLDCVKGENPSSYKDWADAFATCIDAGKIESLDGCTSTCAPTLKMLEASETPTEALYNNFGAGVDSAGAQPAASKCSQ